MVTVSMRNDGALDWLPRIDVEVAGGAVQPTRCCDDEVDHARLDRKLPVHAAFIHICPCGVQQHSGRSHDLPVPGSPVLA